jgi:RecJ-like exonuclease
MNRKFFTIVAAIALVFTLAVQTSPQCYAQWSALFKSATKAAKTAPKAAPKAAPKVTPKVAPREQSPPPQTRFVQCPNCRGTGNVNGVRCNTCYGVGRTTTGRAISSSLYNNR